MQAVREPQPTFMKIESQNHRNVKSKLGKWEELLKCESLCLTLDVIYASPISSLFTPLILIC